MNVKLTIAMLALLMTYLPGGLCRQKGPDNKPTSAGHLFIIGGGEKTEGLMQEMIRVSGISKSGYVIILPMSSDDPDGAVISAKDDFAAVGITQVTGMNFSENGPVIPSQLDSIRKAKLIFITGGDQSRFMKVVGKGPVYEAIHAAYKNGSTIAGTSAGAAVMSKKMLTGNTLKYPEYTGLYPTIEPGNIEITEGLGLVTGIIVDQHFLKRQRLNRLIAALIENPDVTGVGIDESTAIVVTGKSCRIVGENQVVVLRNPGKSIRVKNNLLGASGLVLDVLLPGETFTIK